MDKIPLRTSRDAHVVFATAAEQNVEAVSF